MAQYNTSIRKPQAQLYDGSPNTLNYAIYSSPDRYRQNSFGIKNNVQNYYNQNLINEQNLLLKATTAKKLQRNDLNVLNSLNYNSKMLNNQELWDELNTSQDIPLSQNIVYTPYISQEPVDINLQQKSMMVYGNITPISPNHNKLLSNCNLVGNLSGSELIDSSNFISDINTPTFKENIDVIQQQSKYINSFDNNLLSVSSSLLSISDLKAINDGKMNILTGSNSAEIMAANTLLGPKSNKDTTPLLTDVILMPAENYNNSYTPVSQDNLMTPVSSTPINNPKVPSMAYSQNYQKVNNNFFSPILSPTLNQIYSSNIINNQTKHVTPIPTGSNNVINKTKHNSIPLIKTTINKKTNKLSNSYMATNMKSFNTQFIKTKPSNNNNNNNNNNTNNNNMDIDNQDKENKMIITEVQKHNLIQENKNLNEKEIIMKTLNNIDQESNLLLTKEKSYPLENKTLLPILTASPTSSITNEIVCDNNSIQKEIYEKKEEVIKEDKKNDSKNKNSDNDNMLVDEKLKSPTENYLNNNNKNDNNEKGFKKESKNGSTNKYKYEKEKEKEKKKEEKEKEEEGKREEKKKDLVLKSPSQKENIKKENNNKNIGIIKEKKETTKMTKTKTITKKDENKKKDKKIKENNNQKSEKGLKEKNETQKSESITSKNDTLKEDSLKKTNISKKDSDSKALLSVNTPLKIKKKTRFSLKSAKNDPIALEQHVLLKRKRNTEAARRSRQRKVQQMKNLEETVERLTKELLNTQNELKMTKDKYDKLLEESKNIKENYENEIKLLKEQIKEHNNYSFSSN
ncbi:hypothetical protein BCR32DRAFT_292751 [Anaeromyces robustus]|uniref:BZIP domain-containing protein n=1 Tax=Anaeromyces robustus TaxID=1754192 RepID=A0A1Y1X905_9FUNG|nr:hypothetical protein BCR32DRAFT_292751 [Anaeromyces robustus]|eukprot:ORX82251.1 hypothetical protein BCR32DRAFT_292751 [Anaeromyces robustus]